MRSRCLAVLAVLLACAVPARAQLATSGNAVSQGAGATGGGSFFWNFRLTDGTNFYQALTDAQLRATPVPVSGSGTFTVAGTIVQGNAGSHAQRWMVGLSDGSGFISPATDRTTAASPFSFRLSDGSAFYSTNTAAQLPAALDGSGFLKVHEQGTATISGTVTANAGTNLNTSALALDATLTGGTQKTKIVDSGGTNVATVSAAGAVKVDGSAVTQPVSGTVTTTPPSNASTNVAQVAGTTTDTNSGTKSAGTLRVVLATDQPALTNKLLVTPDSVALPANQSTNVNQFGGSAVVTGTGAGGSGIPRVTVSNDSVVTATQGTAAATTAGWPVTNGTIASSTAAWTSATGLNTTLRLTTTGYNAATVTLNQGTTITAGAITFEASDTTAFTNAYPINCGAGTTYLLSASVKTSFTCDLGAFVAVQVRLSTQIVGSGTVNVGITGSATTPNQPTLTHAWPYPSGNWMDIHGEDNLRFKVWNSAGCLSSLQTCETLQIAVRVRFRRKSDPNTEVITTKILTADNDRAASSYLLSGGFGNFAFGAAAGRGRTVTDADSPGTSLSVTTVSAASPSVVTTAAHGFPVGQIVLINISGTTTTPSVNGPQLATVASSTTFTIPVNVTSGCGSCGGTFYSSNTLTSATAAFTSLDVGKAITLSTGGVACGGSDYICQGPKMPSSTYQGEIIAVTSGTTAIVKPSLLVDPAGSATLIIEPPLLSDGDGKELGDGWLTNVDVNFWGGGQYVGQTYVEGEINQVKDQLGTAFTQHAGWKLFSDYMETSYHLAWPGSHATARHKVGDTHGWTRTIVFGQTGGQNALTISAISAANPAVVTTSAAHGMSIGTLQLVTLAGTNSTPVVDGLRYALVLSATTFSVPVSTSGTGNAGTVTGPYQSPAAGADWIATVPLGAHWRVLSLRAAYVASATVISRNPSIVIDDGANQFYQKQASAPIKAVGVHAIVAGSGVTQGAAQGALGGWSQSISLPATVELQGGGRIRSSTGNIQAGDQWSSIVIEVEEWIEQSTSGVGG